MVERLEIYPLHLTLCVGNNSAGWPVLADQASLRLGMFARRDLNADAATLVSRVWRAYTRVGWVEVYKIIASLDALGSPLSGLRKLRRGIIDVVWLPVEGLVLDDTPGAFAIGLLRGVRSLIVNSVDSLLTTFMKLFVTISWLFGMATLDGYCTYYIIIIIIIIIIILYFCFVFLIVIII